MAGVSGRRLKVNVIAQATQRREPLAILCDTTTSAAFAALVTKRPIVHSFSFIDSFSHVLPSHFFSFPLQ